MPRQAGKKHENPCEKESKTDKTGGMKIVRGKQMAFYDDDLSEQVKAGKHERCDIERVVRFSSLMYRFKALQVSVEVGMG